MASASQPNGSPAALGPDRPRTWTASMRPRTPWPRIWRVSSRPVKRPAMASSTSASASCGARPSIGPSHHAVWSNHRDRSAPEVHEGSVFTDAGVHHTSVAPARATAYAARSPGERSAHDGENVAVPDRRRRCGRARGARPLGPRRRPRRRPMWSCSPTCAVRDPSALEAFAGRLATAGDPLLTPLRVAWLPKERDGRQTARLRDLAAR